MKLQNEHNELSAAYEVVRLMPPGDARAQKKELLDRALDSLLRADMKNRKGLTPFEEVEEVRSLISQVYHEDTRDNRKDNPPVRQRRVA